MRKVIAVGFLINILGVSVQAQQKAQYSQYMINQFVLNPAVTGSTDYGHITAGYRNQWAGAFQGDAPKTYYIAGHSSIERNRGKPHPYRNKHNGYHSAGGIAYNDVTGPTSRLGILGTYAYNERLSGLWRIALGISAGVQQFTLQTENLVFADAEPISTQRKWVPDGNIGGWLYNKHFYFGAAVQQIFQSKLNFEIPDGIDSKTKISKLSNHYFITSGLKLDVAPNWAVIPSFMLKVNRPAPISADINVKVRFMDMVWLGASYRALDAVSILCGVVINNQFDFCYSYDLTTSKVRTYAQSGTHEFMIGYRLWPSAKIENPSDFW
jgi:type IX secretion system PorP/SprF family membrane protein